MNKAIEFIEEHPFAFGEPTKSELIRLIKNIYRYPTSKNTLEHRIYALIASYPYSGTNEEKIEWYNIVEEIIGWLSERNKKCC